MICKLQHLSHFRQLLLAFSPLLSGPIHSRSLVFSLPGNLSTSPGCQASFAAQVWGPSTCSGWVASVHLPLVICRGCPTPSGWLQESDFIVYSPAPIGRWQVKQWGWGGSQCPALTGEGQPLFLFYVCLFSWLCWPLTPWLKFLTSFCSFSRGILFSGFAKTTCWKAINHGFKDLDSLFFSLWANVKLCGKIMTAEGFSHFFPQRLDGFYSVHEKALVVKSFLWMYFCILGWPKSSFRVFHNI